MQGGLINTKTKLSYLQRHKRCACCGDKAKTIDHIIPVQVFEMTMDYEDEYRDAVRDKENWQPMCTPCNARKCARFNPSEVRHSLRAKYSRNIELYVSARKEVLEAQKCKCAKCGAEITEDDSVLMYKRKAKHTDLNSENCIVVCYNCNEVRKANNSKDG